ncbi:MAG: hypothetical protein ACRDTJ_10465 [Pseudonocardiaceae bacterium]
MRNVRNYTRTVNGKKVNVTEHSRTGDAKAKAKGGRGSRRGGGKGPAGRSLARRAWGNTKKAWKAGRRKNKKLALAFGVLALVEIVTFLTLNGVMFALVSIAAIALGTAFAAGSLANGGNKK